MLASSSSRSRGARAGEVVPRLRDLAYFTARASCSSSWSSAATWTPASPSRDARGRARGRGRRAGRHARGHARRRRRASSAIPAHRVDARQPGRAGGLPGARAAARAGRAVCAERREERDFWVVCTTIVVIGVVLTQTRTVAPRPLARGRRLHVARVAADVPPRASARRSRSWRHGAGRRAPAVAVGPRRGWSRRVDVTETASMTDRREPARPHRHRAGQGRGEHGRRARDPTASAPHTVEQREHAPHAHAAHRPHRLGAHDVDRRRGARRHVSCATSAVDDRRLALTLWAIFSSASASSCR